MAISDIRPQEVQATEVETPQVAAIQESTDIPNVAALQSNSAAPPQTAAVDSTPIHAQNLQPLFEEDEDEGPEY